MSNVVEKGETTDAEEEDRLKTKRMRTIVAHELAEKEKRIFKVAKLNEVIADEEKFAEIMRDRYAIQESCFLKEMEEMEQEFSLLKERYKVNLDSSNDMLVVLRAELHSLESIL